MSGPTLILPNANVVPPVAQGQVAVIQGTPGAWVSLVPQMFGSPIPYGGAFGFEGSNDQWHFLQPAPLVIVSANLPPATLLQFYSIPLSASGGLQPYSWRLTSLTSGSPPPSISLASNGLLSGIANGFVGTSVFSVTCSDSAGTTATAVLSIQVVS